MRDNTVVFHVVQPVDPNDNRTEFIVQYWGQTDFGFLDRDPKWISDSVSYRDLSEARDKKRAMLEFRAKVRIIERTVKTGVVE